MFVAFDITDYLVEHNLLNSVYVSLIEFMFLFLGWAGAKIQFKLHQEKHNK